MWRPRALARFYRVALMGSCPMSRRITCGLPRPAMICARVRITPCEGREKSTPMCRAQAGTGSSHIGAISFSISIQANSSLESYNSSP